MGFGFSGRALLPQRLRLNRMRVASDLGTCLGFDAEGEAIQNSIELHAPSEIQIQCEHTEHRDNDAKGCVRKRIVGAVQNHRDQERCCPEQTTPLWVAVGESNEVSRDSSPYRMEER